jgi:hypothetical protein
MGTKLSPKDQALYNAVDEVLHYIWDPIGVSGVPQARDEYYGYLPQIFGMLRCGSNEEDIAAFLGKVVTEQMGLSARPQNDREVASVLVDWKESLDEKFA